EKAFVEAFNEQTPADVLRRARPSIAALHLKDANPLIYHRNRSGKGFIVEGRPQWVHGRELPNLERPDDRLTPERIVLGDAANWIKSPIPVGFDYLDPMGFPRCACFGLAHHYPTPSRDVPEAVRGLIPPDFSKGNILLTGERDLPTLIHPDVARCA